MPTTVRIRLDAETARKLTALARRSSSRNAAVVAAIDAAYRELINNQLRKESRALADDPAYQAEIEAARADMDASDAW